MPLGFDAPPAPAPAPSRPRIQWWGREGLGYRGGELHLGGQGLESLARSAGTPLYAYHAGRVRANLLRLRGALESRSLRFRLFYAMKANRHPPLLTYLRLLGLCGVDVCSPGELARARQVGFAEEELSYTGTSLSDRDVECLARHPGVWVNCDSLSAVRRLGERAPGREIGLRVNPALGVGYRANELLRYSGAEVTKLGIYRGEFAEALRLAERHGLRVAGLHLHTGCGYLTEQLPTWEAVLEAARWFLDQLPHARHLNVGGGLGIPLVADDAPLDLDAWADVLARRLGGWPGEVWLEPGDYLVKDAGVLVLQVNSVEEKAGHRFVGVDGGFNLHIEPAFYQLPLEVVPCREPAPGAPLAAATVAGNINEARDLLARDVPLPPLREGDYLAFLNAGGYGAAMSSDHCMRGDFQEFLVP